MSRTIDERIVSMQFDNKQFESNVATSLSTIERLKQSLNFRGAEKGFDRINASAKACNFIPLGSAIDAVRVKFSALEVAAITTISRITNSAITAGKRIANSLTVDPVRTGFAEYETQIGAIQTILANTQSKGSTLEDVNAALDELNTYADQTIYNFTEMTRNIGTFTAAGVDLEKATTSIKGIANLAAVSGSTSQQASTAMYQLSQALAAGRVSLMDWNSVVNAGMGGQLFQDALKRTATHMGKDVDAIIKKYGSFRESLTQGEWLTTEVLTETLTQLSGAYSKADLIAQGYTESQAEEIAKLAETAVDAATKVKTFTQLMDTLKESAQSGWTKTWQLIIGDFEESKTLWTSVSEVFGKMINDSAESRNKLLEGALMSNWDKLALKIKEAGISTETFEGRIKEVAKENGVDIDKMIEKYGSLEKAFTSGAIESDILKKAVKGLTGSLVDLSKIEGNLKIGDTGKDVSKVQEALKALGYDIGKTGVDGVIGKYTEEAIKAFQKKEGLKVDGIIGPETLAKLEKANKALSSFTGGVDGLINKIDELGGRELLLGGFKNIFTALMQVIKPIKQAFRDIFPPMTSRQLYKLIEGFHEFTEKLKLSDDTILAIHKTAKGLFSIFDVGWTFVKELAGGLWALVGPLPSLGGGFAKAAQSFGDWLANVSTAAKESGVLKTVVGWITGAIQKVIDKVVEWKNKLAAVIEEKGGFVKALGLDLLWEYLKVIWDAIKEFFASFKDLDTLSFDSFLESLKELKEAIFGNSDKNKKPFERTRKAYSRFSSSTSATLEEAGVSVESFKTKIVEFFDAVKTYLGDNLGKVLAIGTILLFVLLLKKIGDAVSLLAKPLEMFGDFLSDIGQAAKNFSLKAKAESFKAVAIAIAVLAGSVALLAMLDYGKVWSSVGAIVVLAGVLVGLTFIINKLDVKDFAKLGLSLMSIAGGFAMLAAAAWILGKTDGDGLVRAAAIMGTVLLALFVVSKLGIKWDALDGFGGMMLKLSVGLLILSVVVKTFGDMDTGVLIKGTAAVATFLVLVAGMMTYAKTIKKDASYFAGMIMKLSIAFILLSSAVKIFGSMDNGILVKGGIAIAAFLGLIALFSKVTNGPTGKNIGKFGTMMMGVGIALYLMAGAVAILGNMDASTIKRGTLTIAAMTGMIAVLMIATKNMGKTGKNGAKLGVMMMSFAASVLIMSAAVIMLSALDGPTLAKSIAALAGITLLYSMMITATSTARSIKTGTLITISIAIGILAASLYILAEFSDTRKLVRAGAALGGVLSAFAVIIQSTGKMGLGFKAIASIVVITAVVAALGHLVVEISKHATNGNETLKIIGSLSLLVVSMGAVCYMLSTVTRTMNPGNIVAALVLFAGVLAIFGIFSAITLSQLPKLGTLLSDFMNNLDNGFISGIKKLSGLKGDGMEGLKMFADSVLAITNASAKFTTTNLFTFGGMSKSLTQFTEFIKSALPVIQELAIEVSKDDTKINTTKIGNVIDIISKISQAITNIPRTTWAALGGGGAFKGFAGGAGGLGASIPMLDEFTKFISEAIPKVKDVAVEVSKNDTKIDTAKLDSVIGTVAKLAETAGKIPTVTIFGAFAGFKGGGGLGGGASWTDFNGFMKFVSGVSTAMSTYATNIGTVELSDRQIKNVESLFKSVSSLAEAVKKAPSYDAIVALGGFGGGWGGATYISIPALTEFASFITAVEPAIRTLATGVKECKLTKEDAENISSICEGVEHLGLAAANAPDRTLALGFAKFAGGGGVGGAYSWKSLTAFVDFIRQVEPIMTTFAGKIKTCSLTEADATALATICKGVEYLGIAAGSAPGITVAAAGFGGWGGGGGGAYVSIPDLHAFKTWITEVVPEMSGFAIDAKDAKITESDAKALVTICESVKYLGEAAKAAPGIEVAAGLAVIGPAIAGGAYVSVPDLVEFKNWIMAIVPAMQNFTVEAIGKGITQEDANALKTICEGVKYLGEAAGAAPKKTDAAFATLLGISAADYVSYTDLDEFNEWLVGTDGNGGIIKSMQDLALTAKAKGITQEEAAALAKICESVKYLGEAAGALDVEESSGMSLLKGFIATDHVSKTNLDEFKKWMVGEDGKSGVIAALTDFTVNVTELGITSEDATLLAEVCNVAKVLAEASKSIPKKKEYETFFGDWVVGSDFSEFAAWVDDMVTVLTDLAATLKENRADLDLVALMSVVNAAKTISEAVEVVTKSYYQSDEFDTEEFKSDVDGIADAIVSFSGKFGSVNLETMSKAAAAAADIVEVIRVLNLVDWKKINTTNFGTVSQAIADKTIAFNDKFKGVDVSNSVAEVAALANQISGLSAMDFTGASSFQSALEDLGKTGVDDFVKAFEDGDTKVTDAANTLVDDCADAIDTDSNVRKFYDAGANLVKGFANGIKANAYISTARAKAMAEAAITAARLALRVNSPAKTMIPIGEAVPEGMALGIDRMAGLVKSSSVGMAKTAIDGTKRAIARISDYVNSDIDTQPTIRPVLDLSAVSAGAGQISNLLDLTPSVGVTSNIRSIGSRMNERQNGVNDDVISAIKDLGRTLGDRPGDTYSINGITYDDGSNVSEAVRTLVRAARVERRR